MTIFSVTAIIAIAVKNFMARILTVFWRTNHVIVWHPDLERFPYNFMTSDITVRVIIAYLIVSISIVYAAPPSLGDGLVREYFIAAVEVDWDYAPSGNNLITHQSLESSAEVQITTLKGKNRIGHVYKKALYWGYDDAAFTQPSPRYPVFCFIFT